MVDKTKKYLSASVASALLYSRAHEMLESERRVNSETMCRNFGTLQNVAAIHHAVSGESA